MEKYGVISKTIIILFLYFLSYLLVKYKKIKLLTQRRFWNIVLLISFLISGALGLIMALIIDQGDLVDWYPKILNIHVKTGIIMAIISIIHIFWHTRYYTAIFKRKK